MGLQIKNKNLNWQVRDRGSSGRNGPLSRVLPTAITFLHYLVSCFLYLMHLKVFSFSFSLLLSSPSSSKGDNIPFLIERQSSLTCYLLILNRAPYSFAIWLLRDAVLYSLNKKLWNKGQLYSFTRNLLNCWSWPSPTSIFGSHNWFKNEMY